MKKRVLVVERDADIRQLIQYLLSEAGYQAISISDEDNIFPAIRKEKPDVIILDVLNPHKDADLCKEIKATKDLGHIPIIVLSTYSKIEIMKEICADDTIPKPFDIQDFIATVEKQLVA